MSATPVDAYASTDSAAAGRAAGRRRWPLLLIGASAGTATWSGWVGLGELTGFGVVHPLPGIWDSLTVNTAITLPIGVEAYAVYALAVATDSRPLTPLARRWAWASAAGALLLGMGGQIAYHLLEAHQVTVAPWWVVALVSSLPVLVLGAASLLWHLAAAPVPSPQAGPEAVPVDLTVVTMDASAVSGDGAASTPERHLREVGAAARPVSVGRRLDEPAVLGGAAADTPTPSPGVSGPGAGDGPRALPRPTATTRVPATTASTGRPAKVTATIATPGDAEILAALTRDPAADGPPSIRALMRTYGVGQARATRLHRALRHVQPTSDAAASDAAGPTAKPASHGDTEQRTDPSEPADEHDHTRSEQPERHQEESD